MTQYVMSLEHPLGFSHISWQRDLKIEEQVYRDRYLKRDYDYLLRLKKEGIITSQKFFGLLPLRGIIIWERFEVLGGFPGTLITIHYLWWGFQGSI